MHRKNILIIIFFVFLAFANALWNDFTGDDEMLITNNTFYRSLENFPRLFQQGYIFDWEKSSFSNNPDRGTGSVSYRPVANAAYFLDFKLWGLLPWGYHLSNILIHMCNVVLVYGLLMGLGIAAGSALFASLLFGLHPVQSEVVCSIGYRADLLASLFVLLAFHSWMVFTANKRVMFYGISLISYALAVFSKESAVMFPVLLFVYERFFRYKQQEKSWNAGFFQFGFWGVTLFYIYVYSFVFPNAALPGNHWLGDNFVVQGIRMGKIWVEYILSFIFPWSVHQIPSLYAPVLHGLCREIEIFVLVVSIFMVVIYSYWRQHNRLIVFLLAWFLIFYMPVSNIIPLANPMAFRFLYLPSIGFLSAMAFLLEGTYSWSGVKNISFRLVLFLRMFTIILCFILTVLLNSLWQNNYLIASMWIKYYPDSPKAYFVMGMLHFHKGDYQKAKEFFEWSDHYGIREKDARVDYYIGRCYLAQGQVAQARPYLEAAQVVLPDVVNMEKLINAYKKKE